MSLEYLERLMPKEMGTKERPGYNSALMCQAYNQCRAETLQALKGKVVVLAELKEEEIENILSVFIKIDDEKDRNYLYKLISKSILTYIQSKAREQHGNI